MELQFKYYRRKPVAIQALVLTEELWEEIYGKKDHSILINNYELVAGYQQSHIQDKCFYVQTLEDVEDGKLHKGQLGDYLIMGIAGEIYACKPSIFQRTYEEIQ